MGVITAKIAEVKSSADLSVIYTEALAYHVLRSEYVLAIGFAQWVGLLLCAAVWLWWPFGLASLWVSLHFARLVGNATWDEITSPTTQTEE